MLNTFFSPQIRMQWKKYSVTCCRIVLVACFLIFSGCAGMGHRYDSPQVTLADIRLSSIKAFEQQYKITFRVQNPNSTAFTIQGISFRLDVNKSQFLQGSSKQNVSIPAFGTALIETDVYSNFFKFIKQFRGLGSSGGGLFKYRLSGKVYVAGSPVPLPFDKEGSIGSLMNGTSGEKL